MFACSLVTVAGCASNTKVPVQTVFPTQAPAATFQLPPAPSGPSKSDVITDPPTIKAAQQTLVLLGYGAGKADGVIGGATRTAIRAFQKDHRLGQDGELSFVLMKILTDVAEEAQRGELILRQGDVLVYDNGQTEAVKAKRIISWNAEGSKKLMAVRPATSAWPAAARAGLEWALTHALDAPAGASETKWSSTGVNEQFQIRTYALLQREIDLVGDESGSCRRFELRIEDSHFRYPGLACRDQKNQWFIPHSSVRFHRPASALEKSAH